MDKKKNERADRPFDEADDPFYDITTTSSSTECTGLVPSGVMSEAESDAYGDLYAIHPPKSQAQELNDQMGKGRKG